MELGRLLVEDVAFYQLLSLLELYLALISVGKNLWIPNQARSPHYYAFLGVSLGVKHMR